MKVQYEDDTVLILNILDAVIQHFHLVEFGKRTLIITVEVAFQWVVILVLQFACF